MLLEAFANHFSRVFFKVKFPGLVLELDFPGRGLMQDEFIAAVFELFTGDRTQVFHGIDHPEKGAGIEEELHRLRGGGDQSPEAVNLLSRKSFSRSASASKNESSRRTMPLS